MLEVGGTSTVFYCLSLVNYSLIKKKLLQFKRSILAERVCHIGVITLYRVRRNKYEVVVKTATFVRHVFLVGDLFLDDYFFCGFIDIWQCSTRCSLCCTIYSISYIDVNNSPS